MKILILSMMTFGLFACSSMTQQRTTASTPSQAETPAAESSQSLGSINKKKDGKKELLKYYMTVAKTSKIRVADNSHGRYCDDESDPSCISTICERGGFSCQFESDIVKAAKLCRGIRDARCITEVCNQGGFSCQFQSDLEKVGELCKDSVGPCVKKVCSLGGFSCQFESDVTKVAKLCANVEPRCVEDLCGRGSFSCQFESDLTKAINLCKGDW